MLGNGEAQARAQVAVLGLVIQLGGDASRQGQAAAALGQQLLDQGVQNAVVGGRDGHHQIGLLLLGQCCHIPDVACNDMILDSDGDATLTCCLLLASI